MRKDIKEGLWAAVPTAILMALIVREGITPGWFVIQTFFLWSFCYALINLPNPR